MKKNNNNDNKNNNTIWWHRPLKPQGKIRDRQVMKLMTRNWQEWISGDSLCVPYRHRYIKG
jgi:hypothetical protein